MNSLTILVLGIAEGEVTDEECKSLLLDMLRQRAETSPRATDFRDRFDRVVDSGAEIARAPRGPAFDGVNGNESSAPPQSELDGAAPAGTA